jgi:plastocyanin
MSARRESTEADGRELARRGVGLVLALVLALVVSACGDTPTPPPASTAPALDPATTGTVSGRVVLDGTPPAARTIRMDGDRKCLSLVPGGSRPVPAYVVGEGGGLANVFVYVKSGLDGRSFPVPSEPVVLDQQQCWYVPRVLGVRVGQPLRALNSDPLLHNVRAAATVNEPFNQGQPIQGISYTHTFSTEEVMVPFKCDVHAWMNAWVGVVNHPYFAVTGPSGEFSLPNLPAGTYTVDAWHEAAGLQTGSVSVTARGTATLSLTFTVPTA